MTTVVRALAATVSMVVLWAGCSYDPAELSQLEAAIVNGTFDPGHPAVGVLASQGEGICTGTLVGTHTVLTAAHCVVQEDQPPYTLRPQQGFSHNGQAYPIPAVSVVYHPAYDGKIFDNDVAVVRLSQDLPIPPVLVAKTAPTVGEKIEIVGYGVTSDDANDFGTKRRASNTIGQVGPTQYIFYGASGNIGSQCYGDSGGPSFAVRGGKELQIGVHSWGPGTCGTAEHDARADAFYGWIKQQAQGNLHESASLEDAKPPDVKILTPAPSATVASAFPVEVSAHDDIGVVRVELLVDGQLVNTQQQPKGNCQFQVNGLPAGSHNLRAEAVDASGKRGSALVTVMVQQQQPGPNPDPPPPLPNPDPPVNPAVPGPATGGGVMMGSCILVPAGAPATVPWVLLLLPLLLVRRRRR